MHSKPAPPPSAGRMVAETRTARAQVRDLVRRGQWRAAEPDRERARAFDAAGGAEALVGTTDDLQPAAFLVAGAAVRRAVAYVEVSRGRESLTGTGFLISPRLLITNQHVIADADAAHGAQLTFDREIMTDGRPCPATSFLLAPERCALFSPSDQFDYAVIAVGERNNGVAELTDLGCCPLSNTPDRHRIGMAVNIIQHPDGLPKMIAVRNNLLTFRTARTLLYETDTDHGSSGSPVFNDRWEVIALHHWGFPALEPRDADGTPFPTNVNEGVRISAIYADLVARCPGLPPAQRALLEEALALARPAPDAPRLAPPRPEAGEAAARGAPNITPRPTGNTAMPTDHLLRFTVPLEITVRLGDVPSTAAAIAAAGNATGAVAPRTLVRGAEAITVDADYAARRGYDPAFIPGSTVPLPVPGAALARQIAALRPTEPEAATGVLRYEHFSVVLNRAKRLAMFTATNIDGATYLAVDRGTGTAAEGAEGDRWFTDPRISESFCTGQAFYSEWSLFFDRGHLTRRSDPTWGPAEESERANADTFHFTNCSPQHFRFNQTTPYWQGAERYVLENGVLAQDDRKRICVFQGPIFNASIDRYAGELQIPSSFFKVIVWQGGNGLKAVGLIVDQLALLDEERKRFAPPKEVPSVNVAHWRVSIPTIEKRTGLSFGPAVAAADTIASRTQPDVGGEAAVRIDKMADLLA